MPSNAIEIHNLWKTFRLYHEKNQYLKAAVLRGRRARYEEFWALKDVSFDVAPGEVFVVMGLSGSGKSTLAYSIAGHPKYLITGGSVTLDGVDVLEMSVDERAKAGLFLKHLSRQK